MTATTTGTVAFNVFLLLTVISIKPAHSANVGTSTYQHDLSVAEQERELFAGCTWPFDPTSLSPRFSAPKDGFLLEDTRAMFALIVFIALGVPVMLTDVCELSEDQRNEEMDKTPKKHKLRTDAASNVKRPAAALPIAFTLFVLILAFALATIPTDNVAATCQRYPLLSGSPGLRAAPEGYAMEELLRLPNLNHAQPTMPDSVVALLLCALAGVGLLVGHSDFQGMRAETNADEEATQCEEKKQHAKKSPKACPPNELHASAHGAASENLISGHKTDSASNSNALTLTIRFALAIVAAGYFMLCEKVLWRRWLRTHDSYPVPAFVTSHPANQARMSSPVVSDEAVILYVGGFALFGLMFMCSDFHTFVAELQRKENAAMQVKGDQASKVKGDKAPTDAKWFSAAWRTLSCMVLLLSMFGAAAAAIWEMWM